MFVSCLDERGCSQCITAVIRKAASAPLSKYTRNEGCSCSDRCSFSSSSKLFISQVLLCIFQALSPKGWISVPNSPRVEASTARRGWTTLYNPCSSPTTAETQTGSQRSVPAAHTGSQSSLPQGWACPAQGREGRHNPWAGLWGRTGFSFSSCSPEGYKAADTETTSQHHPALPCSCLWCSYHLPSQKPTECITDPTPLVYLCMTPSSLWERFPGVLTSAKFNQGFFTIVELWEAGNTFYSKSQLSISSLNSYEQWLVPKHNHLFFNLLLMSNSTCSLKWVRND